ncbi:hypothetical protein [Azospirillum canadense]|uniref:hypothetical protein n=1 Tax=Azospirillum canadense TaxID=403962 RepID=UPI0022275B61|nr:hypothetical protein [Azospirillum canadense]MCW2240475.1 hypothetical protein [Azospirillum canadense]
MELAPPDVNNASPVGPLLEPVTAPLKRLGGNGGYDRTDVYATEVARRREAAVIAPPRADAVLSATVDTAPPPRGRYLLAIAEMGRMAWQRASGDNARARWRRRSRAAGR